jgi:microcompartment protein CcmL/EutN
MAKDSFKETLRKVFKPTIEERIENMGSLLNNLFCIGNPRDDVLKVIVKNKKITPQKKLNLVCDCLGEYYGGTTQIIYVDRYVREVYHKASSEARFDYSNIPQERPCIDTETHNSWCSIVKAEDTIETNCILQETVLTIFNQANAAGISDADLMGSLDEDVKAIVEESQRFDKQDPEASNLKNMLVERWNKTQDQNAAQNNQPADKSTETKPTSSSEEQPPEF